MMVCLYFCITECAATCCFLLLFLIFSCSTPCDIQEEQRPNLHGGVSEGIPETLPGPPHHSIVILPLVHPIAVVFPIQICSMTPGTNNDVSGAMSKLNTNDIIYAHTHTHTRLYIQNINKFIYVYTFFTCIKSVCVSVCMSSSHESVQVHVLYVRGLTC